MDSNRILRHDNRVYLIGRAFPFLRSVPVYAALGYGGMSTFDTMHRQYVPIVPIHNSLQSMANHSTARIPHNPSMTGPTIYFEPSARPALLIPQINQHYGTNPPLGHGSDMPRSSAFPTPVPLPLFTDNPFPRPDSLLQHVINLGFTDLYKPAGAQSELPVPQLADAVQPFLEADAQPLPEIEVHESVKTIPLSISEHEVAATSALPDELLHTLYHRVSGTHFECLWNDENGPCAVTANRLCRIKSHLNTHLNCKPFLCNGLCNNSTCVEAFSSAARLQEHIARKLNRTKECPVCKQSVTVQNMNRHMKLHVQIAS